MRRVVVTGMGIVSPLGNDLATSWDGIVNGRSGIGRVTHFDAFAKCFPLGAREDLEASVRVARVGEPVLRRRRQDVTMPGRHGEPPLGIETQRRRALEHLCQPSLRWKRRVWRDIPLSTTSLHFFAL